MGEQQSGVGGVTGVVGDVDAVGIKIDNEVVNEVSQWHGNGGVVDECAVAVIVECGPPYSIVGAYILNHCGGNDVWLGCWNADGAGDVGDAFSGYVLADGIVD